LSKDADPSKAAAPSARPAARSFRPQATRVGRLTTYRSLLRRLSWLVLAAPLLGIIVADGLGDQPTLAGAAPTGSGLVAAAPGAAAAEPLIRASLAARGPPLPAPSVRLAAPAAGPLDAAEIARRIGDYDRAAALLRELANGQDKQVANDALLQLAVVQI